MWLKEVIEKADPSKLCGYDRWFWTISSCLFFIYTYSLPMGSSGGRGVADANPLVSREGWDEQRLRLGRWRLRWFRLGLTATGCLEAMANLEWQLWVSSYVHDLVQGSLYETRLGIRMDERGHRVWEGGCQGLPRGLGRTPRSISSTLTLKTKIHTAVTDHTFTCRLPQLAHLYPSSDYFWILYCTICS